MKKALKIFSILFLVLILWVIQIYAISDNTMLEGITDILIDPPGLYISSPFLYNISPIVFNTMIALGIISIIIVILTKNKNRKFIVIYILMYVISGLINIKLNAVYNAASLMIKSEFIKYVVMLITCIILRLIMVMYPIIKLVKIKKTDKKPKGEN